MAQHTENQPDLLGVMAPAGNVYLRSPFVPSSWPWFSDLDDQVTEVMRRGVDVYVIDNLRRKLQGKTDDELKQGADALSAVTATGADEPAARGPAADGADEDTDQMSAAAAGRPDFRCV